MFGIFSSHKASRGMKKYEEIIMKKYEGKYAGNMKKMLL